MSARQTKPAISPDKLGQPGYTKCEVSYLDNGTASVTFLIEDPSVVKRLEQRAGSIDLGRYLFENVLYRAVVDHVY